MLKEFVDSVILYLLLTLVTLLFGFGLAFIRAKLDNEKHITLRTLALDAVLYAQEKQSGYAGVVRWDIASSLIEAQAKKKGIKVGTEEIDILLHSVLKELKLSAGEKWKDVTKYPAVDEEGNPNGESETDTVTSEGVDPNLT